MLFIKALTLFICWLLHHWLVFPLTHTLGSTIRRRRTILVITLARGLLSRC
jgi:hypothetical protein